MLRRKEVVGLAGGLALMASLGVTSACSSHRDAFDGDQPLDVSIEAQPGIKPSLSPALGSGPRVLLVEPPPLTFVDAPEDLAWPDEPLDEPLLVLVCADWVTACLAFDRSEVVRDREVRAVASSFRALRVDVTESAEHHDAFLQRLEATAMPFVAVTGCRSKPHRRSIRTLDVETITSALSACIAREP